MRSHCLYYLALGQYIVNGVGGLSKTYIDSASMYVCGTMMVCMSIHDVP